MGGYALPGDHVAGEVVDNELIIMNLGAGIYYSAPGSGSLIWNALVSGVDMDAAIALLTEHAADPAAFEAGARAMVAMLLDSEAIVPRETPVPLDTASLLSALGAAPLGAPTIEAHRDMEDILMLDPIHDVGEAGWPLRPGASGKPGAP